MKHIRTTAYYPYANGLVERFHRSLKTSLATRNDTTNWVDDLPLILLSLRNTVKEDLGCSAAELSSLAHLFQCQDTISHLTPRLNTNFAQEFQHKMAKLAYTPHHLKECEFIFVGNDAVKRPLTPTYMGPFKVVNRTLRSSVVTTMTWSPLTRSKTLL